MNLVLMLFTQFIFLDCYCKIRQLLWYHLCSWLSNVVVWVIITLSRVLKNIVFVSEKKTKKRRLCNVYMLFFNTSSAFKYLTLGVSDEGKSRNALRRIQLSNVLFSICYFVWDCKIWFSLSLNCLSFKQYLSGCTCVIRILTLINWGSNNQ